MVFLPLKDDNPLKFIWFQFATLTLIVINTAVFIWQQSLGEQGIATIAQMAGVTPVSLFGGAPLPEWLGHLPSEVTLVTYMFLHGDWMHLGGNMLFLWVFGDNIEDAMGSIRFTMFYLLAGVAAGLAHVYMNPGSEAPLIGASGAIAGIIEVENADDRKKIESDRKKMEVFLTELPHQAHAIVDEQWLYTLTNVPVGEHSISIKFIDSEKIIKKDIVKVTHAQAIAKKNITITKKDMEGTQTQSQDAAP